MKVRSYRIAGFGYLALALTSFASLGQPEAAPPPKPSLKELAAASAAVVVAKVEAVEPHQPALHQAGFPITKVRLAIEEVIAGSLEEQSLVFDVPGGYEPTGEITKFTEVPVFEPQQTYLVFLRGGAWGFSPVTSYTHGIFKLTTFAGKRCFVDQSGRGVAGIGEPGFNFKGLVEGSAWPRYAREGLKDGISVPEPDDDLRNSYVINQKGAQDADETLRALRALMGSVQLSASAIHVSSDLPPAPSPEERLRRAKMKQAQGLQRK